MSYISDLDTALAQARRLYHHAANFGAVTADDIGRLVTTMEGAQQAAGAGAGGLWRALGLEVAGRYEKAMAAVPDPLTALRTLRKAIAAMRDGTQWSISLAELDAAEAAVAVAIEDQIPGTEYRG